jgi:hypothetical protein
VGADEAKFANELLGTKVLQIFWKSTSGAALSMKGIVRPAGIAPGHRTDL